MAKTKRKLTRAEKGELTRKNLLEAAVEVVGERGYGDASVTNITTRARIAQGTFYNYFESKQDILDQLLPELGEVLLDYLGDRVGSATFLEREERSLRAYFDFIREHPEFYRILLEAQVYSPDSYARHAQNLTRNYVAALRKNKENGFLPSYSDEEFEALAIILLGARVQLMGHYCFRNGRVRAIPEHVIGTFMKFLASGFGPGGTGTGKRRKTPERREQPARWYTAVALDVSGQELSVRYGITAEDHAERPSDSDHALQELVADLLRRTIDSISPSGTRLRGNNLLLFARELPARIEASCRIEAASASETIASFVLTEAAGGRASRLASGQAVLSTPPD